MISKRISIILSFILIQNAFAIKVPDEGMYPLSDIRNVDLKTAGLKISVDELYNPGGVSLVDALVKIGGCTGSFVSNEGLVLTNHHCSFSYIQKASTLENNYLENGFTAMQRKDEIPAEGLTCRITESYFDVSDQILEAANKTTDPLERMISIAAKMKELIKIEEQKDSSIKAEISEMFKGEKYILFRYKIINDVRLVYAPPRTIGEFGGETDNWIWPRHTGDFSFMRAYVAPDGKSAMYSENNIPYTPKKYLKVNPSGVEENDFVFILGYPGTTFRHQPSQFIEYQNQYLLPYTSELYNWVINYYEEEGKTDPAFALEISTKIKSLANTMKNYNGKMQGISRTGLIDNLKTEESELKAFISSDKELSKKFGSIFGEIDEVYKEIFANGRVSLFLSQLSRNITLYKLTEILLDKNKNGVEAKIKQIDDLYKSFHAKHDQDILKKMITDAMEFPEFENIEFFKRLKMKMGGIDPVGTFVSGIYQRTELKDKAVFMDLYNNSKVNEGDPLYSFVKEMEDLDEARKNNSKKLDGKLNILHSQLSEVKKLKLNKSFVPDANSTLRLTFGYIKGYSPADAVYYSPFSSLKGIIEKGTAEGDYRIFPKLKELYNKKDFDKYISKKNGEVPVALLYNTDTTGGNSGSPVMNAMGELIGLNFDRTFEATINDYLWSPDYSRSIGVDIRFILWCTDKVGNAGHLVSEMGIN